MIQVSRTTLILAIIDMIEFEEAKLLQIECFQRVVDEKPGTLGRPFGNLEELTIEKIEVINQLIMIKAQAKQEASSNQFEVRILELLKAQLQRVIIIS